MNVDVILPKLGLTMEEGTIVRWLKGVGDRVEPGEALFEVESDKSVQEVEVAAAGFLAEILVGEGEAAPVTTVVARIRIEAAEEPTTVAPSLLPEPTEDLPSASVLPDAVGTATDQEAHVAAEKAESPADRRFVSWRARRAASEAGLDISALPPGSGPGGRVIERDVLAALQEHEIPSPGEWQPLTPAQRVTAERMAQSFSTAPHFYLTVEVDAGPLLAYRQAKLGEVEAATGIHLTVSDLLMRAAALALRDNPRANAAWVDGKIRLYQEVHIGLAVSTPYGLLVPVIRNADRKGLAEIAHERFHIIGKAQKNRLAPDELQGGTFTLTNLGMYGIDTFQAILNPPQSAILAVGRIKERPYASNGQLGTRPTCYLTLSCDHRVLDGVTGAAFLQAVVRLLESPELMD